MLTSSNQYLRPEYLTPLPTTLDAKKSPLALLAQTCSQIGADTSNSKLMQSTDKNKNKIDPSKDKSSGDTTQKLNFSRPYESSREKSRTPEERSSNNSSSSRVRTPTAAKNSTPSSNNRCSSNQSATSPRSSPLVTDRDRDRERKTPANDNNRSEDVTTPTSKHGTDERNSPHTPVSLSSSSSSVSLPKSSGTFTPTVLSNCSSSSASSTASSSAIDVAAAMAAYKPGSMPTTSPFLGAYAPPGFPMDLMTSSLMSHHMLKASTGLSPYLNYARLKGPPPPGSEYVSTCRDPYCTGCGLSSHLLSGTATSSAHAAKSNGCPAGCTQCDHATSKAQSSAAAAAYLGGHSQAAAAAYAHAQLAVLAAASHLPYVCNWISGDAAYCGKRFSSSEELLSHLRTHTSVSVSEASGGGGGGLSMSTLAGLPPTHPLFHRTYPTPPLSPLATARYHPYSKPSSLLPASLSSPLSSLPPLGHPGLPPYLSPYSLYGPRLGTAPGMHP